MSLGAWGDEGDIHECNPRCDAAREEGFEDGWEEALERAAVIIEGAYPADGDKADPKALAMSLRAMKAWDAKRRAA